MKLFLENSQLCKYLLNYLISLKSMCFEIFPLRTTPMACDVTDGVGRNRKNRNREH